MTADFLAVICASWNTNSPEQSRSQTRISTYFSHLIKSNYRWALWPRKTDDEGEMELGGGGMGESKNALCVETRSWNNCLQKRR